ncbi:phospho-N-acetylmuramoyl-pentapeptide-transferase [Corynebacterium sphenisci DSM 44792]|uniref:Phospho-N-acetylmuramoyl-pentapeptide-transferase n=1 Tax=Corynebacterium sphenisci DSM 44792 TaxID=1437874 RepID=A0A1L7CYQ3_9CORY|nr:phospho-N-acetylmuramoyl-pentapeptide-transferase [Corynebacterium sphenisci]APT90960.1 phospho-N-acetylmuramoyl-pentapeptide-transferase [Corynebacterium sphenisci DSM 44792]
MTQLMLSGAVAFIVTVLLTPVLIRRFTADGIGQEIREEGPASHQRKRGTPTMGGIAIIAGLVAGYVAAHVLGAFTVGGGPTASGLLVLFLALSMGALGFADDFIKIYKGRNLGLNKKAKLIGQLAAALIFGVLLLRFPGGDDLTPGSTSLSFIRDISTWNLAPGPAWLGMVVFLVFVFIVIGGWTNAVNLTDGLDGLAAGAMALLLITYSAITFWQFRYSCGESAVPGCYTVRDPLDVSFLAAAGLGACLGFLWWNAAPAQIFMGDTGSLALGGLVAGLGFVTRTELLMAIIGFLFVMEVVSVIIQVAVFQTVGKRPFRMAPLHHHFENGGWAETTVVIRFWLLAAIFNLVGFALFYGDWLLETGLLQ